MKRLLYTLACVTLTACGGGSAPRDLKCENLVDPLAIETTSPRLSWKIPARKEGNTQTAFQIVAASGIGLLAPGKADLWDSGRVESGESVLVPWQGAPLGSRSQVLWKVRTWDAEGRASAWSPAAALGIGLLEAGDWSGEYIGLDSLEGANQCPMLRSPFVSVKDARYLLHVNSLGYHEVWLNGAKVGENVLAPAVSQTGKRSLIVTYDLTGLVRGDGNDLVLWLGQGWYRPDLPGVVYPGALVRAQIEEYSDGECRTILATDGGWKARASAYTGPGSWRPHEFGGERVDGTKMLDDMTTATLDAVAWSDAVVVEIPPHRVSPQMTEPNVVAGTFKPVSVTPAGEGEWLVDMGRVLNGFTRVVFRGLPPAREITMRYGDHLNSDGSPNLGTRQQDRYIARGVDGEVFENRFNHHAYQYIVISGLDRAPSAEDITGYLVTTGYSDASSFECSDPEMNAIHDMVRYTLRCLTWGGYMVDCPHIERLGYGGDGHGSTVTAHTMYDMHALYVNWMHAWEDSQRPDGWLPHTAPNPYLAGGGPYWCAFIVSAPWETWLAYGDRRILEQYYPHMQLWFDYVRAHSVDGLLQRWPDDQMRWWFLGDWATPPGVDQTAPESIGLVSNCVVSESLGTMARIAQLLGRGEDAERYAAWKRETDRLIHETWFDPASGSYASGSQIDRIYPMLTGATPASLLPEVERGLVWETVEKHGGHLATGLVGIPVMVEWAVKNRKVDFVYDQLRKHEFPGYLHMIDNGATTTWEHWDGRRSRVHNCFNGIGSWFYNAIGGLRPDADAPGWRHSIIDIQIPSEGISWARTSKETPYGTLSVHWTLENGTVRVKAIVPPGCTSEVILPEGGDPVMLSSGSHSLSYDLPAKLR